MDKIPLSGYSPIDGSGVQRTDLHCHACSGNFVAELDFDIQGNHIIECPHCNHEHFRTIEAGKITESRWGSNNDSSKATPARSVWKSSVIKAKTSTVSSFIRDCWLNRSDARG